MNYVDVCTGIDAASVAWMSLSWRCAAVAEIEPFPCAVLAERFGASRPQFMPQVEGGDSEEVARDKRAAIKAVSRLQVTGRIPNRGDFTTIKGDEYGAIDLLVGGTPCQDFSVAGLRAGMDGKRGQLTVEFAKLAHRLAAKARSRWVLWENVPGVLSIDGGEAFATFLGILAKRSVRIPEGGWANSGIVAGGDDSFGLAYRVLDAQYAGVPQRRRRVFVVGYFGDWRRAAAVLFERHSLSGDSPPRREKGQVAPTIPARSLGGGGLGTDFDLDGGVIRTPFLSSSEGHFDREDYEHTGRLTPITMSTGQAGAEIGIGIGTTLNCNHEAPIVTHSLRGEGFDASEDGTGRGTPLVPISIQAGCVRENPDSGPDGVGVRADGIAYTLEARAEVQAVGFMPARTLAKDGEVDSRYAERDICDALHTGSGQGNKAPIIAFSSKDHGADAGKISPTLRSMSHDGSHANGGGQVAVAYRTNAAGQVDEQGERTAALTTQTDPSSHFIAIPNENILAFRAAGQEGFTPSDQSPPLASTDGGGAGVPTVMTLAIRGREGEPTLEVREDGIANAVLTPNGGRGGIGVGAIAIQNATRGKEQNGLGISDDGSMYTLDQGSQYGVGVPLNDPTQYNGIHGRTPETNSTEVLRSLRQEIGEASFAEWGVGVLDLVRKEEVLQPEMLRSGQRAALTEEGCQVECISPQSTEDMPQGSVFEVWSTECSGRSPQGWRLAEQRAAQLRAYLSLLSQQGALQGKALRDLRTAAEGIGVLQQGLDSIQEIWRSSCLEDAPSKDVSGLRNTGAQQRLMREALHAMEARQSARVNGGVGVMAVRHLTPL